MSNLSELRGERIARSLLFVPGDRPERFNKAVGSGAHDVILDLEDAVSPSSKSEARDAVVAWLSQSKRAIIRINGADTPWFQDDLEMVKSVPSAIVMLPKADPESLIYTAGTLPGRPVIGLVETVKGFLNLRQLVAVPGLTRIAFGSVDFSAETGIADECDAMTAIRTQIVLESCYAGLAAPVDGVSLRFDDEDSLRADVQRSRQLGFGGKLCIHPRQVAAVNSGFRPAGSQVEWATRVLAAYEANDGGVTTVDGVMVDKPVVEQARQILSNAQS